MSKLDKIIKSNTMGGSGRFDSENAKQDIKALFKELIGEDEDIYGDLEWPWSKERKKQERDDFRRQLRQKVDEL